MQQIASSQNIRNETLEGILVYYQRNSALPSETINNKSFAVSESNDDSIKWEDIFNNSDILTVEGFEKCLQIFNTTSKRHHYRDVERFSQEALYRLKERDLWAFIDILLLSELSLYEIKSFFNSLPNEWKNKISYKRKWPDLVKKLGRKYAQELVNPYSYKYFINDINLNTSDIDKLKEGILEGLASGYELSSAEMYFCFVSMAITKINPLNAIDLLDFALSRFELHIDSDFGDGEWSEWLFTTKDINKNIAGFIWSAFGAPRSAERWNAAHSVRMLVELNCTNVIDELINWMQFDKVGAFGNCNFPFYNLHARMYFLIALARISLQKPELLVKYKDVFQKYAISEPHILIQKFSSEIALNIEASFPGTYDTMMLDVLRNSGKSTIAVQKMDYNDTVNSYWHANNEIDTEYDFHFAYDFDRYWFEPLSDVFGLPRNQVEDLAAHVILKEWKIKSKSGYNDDPRVSIWNKNPNERETWHDHFSYPRTDNFDFYLSYHSMMVAAAKLLKKMPVVSKRDWYENEWEEWLSEHLLTCTDGKWLADYRDPTPLKRPEWISKNKNDSWRTEISEKNFYEALLTDDNGEIWINIRGAWQESTSDRDERFSIASALVSKCTSDALMRALETCGDPYDYKLPDYDESNMEIDSGSFVLKGWLKGESVSKRLDEYDPYADNIDYPPYVMGDDITTKLKLSVSDDGKIWYSPMSTLPTIKSKIWSSHRAGRDENPNQAGNQIKASLEFLKHLCTTLNCDLILDVGIEREINYKYRSQEEKYEYSKPKHNIFILSSNGELRNIGQNYKLG